MSTTDSQKNRRACRAMIRHYLGTAGLCFEANPKRQVIHVGIHGCDGAGSSLTFNATEYRELILKLLGVDIGTIADLRAAVNGAALLTELRVRLENLTAQAVPCEGDRNHVVPSVYVKEARRTLQKLKDGGAR